MKQERGAQLRLPEKVHKKASKKHHKKPVQHVIALKTVDCGRG